MTGGPPDGGHEEAEELDLVRVAVDAHQDPAARPDDSRQLADALRHVREQHHAELRSGDVEAVVVELERVTVHDSRLDAEPFLARPLPEPLEHPRGEVRRDHVGPEPRRRDAQRTAAGRDVEEPHSRM